MQKSQHKYADLCIHGYALKSEQLGTMAKCPRNDATKFKDWKHNAECWLKAWINLAITLNLALTFVKNYAFSSRYAFNPVNGIRKIV